MPASRAIILDLETSGLSPNYGAKIIEIGMIKVENGKIVDKFQKLINPGFSISHEITDYTGITNKMLNGKPTWYKLRNPILDFIEDYNIIAHNYSFDKRFLDH